MRRNLITGGMQLQPVRVKPALSACGMQFRVLPQNNVL